MKLNTKSRIYYFTKINEKRSITLKEINKINKDMSEEDFRKWLVIKNE